MYFSAAYQNLIYLGHLQLGTIGNELLVF